MLPWKRLLRPLAALLLTAAVTVVPTAAAATAATAQAESAPSSGWNDYSCKPSAAHPRPVVLVHGTFANSVDNWLGLAPYLVNRGYCVFSLDYGQLPGVPFFNGLGPIDKSAEQLKTFVDKVLAATGAAKADLVGHSQGGMMPRYYLKFLGGAAKVNALVGHRPRQPRHHPERTDRTARPTSPARRTCCRRRPPALADQVAGSAFLTKLNAGGDTVPGVRYTVIATRYDEVVTPYRSQFLDGPNVRNVLLQDLCAVDLSEHVAIGLIDRIAFHEVANALDPGARHPDDLRVGDRLSGLARRPCTGARGRAVSPGRPAIPRPCRRPAAVAAGAPPGDGPTRTGPRRRAPGRRRRRSRRTGWCCRRRSRRGSRSRRRARRRSRVAVALGRGLPSRRSRRRCRPEPGVGARGRRGRRPGSSASSSPWPPCSTDDLSAAVRDLPGRTGPTRSGPWWPGRPLRRRRPPPNTTSEQV